MFRGRKFESKRSYYDAPISSFLTHSDEEILGALTGNSRFAVELSQRDAWVTQIRILRCVLEAYLDLGWVHFEFAVPRVGRRIDVLAVIRDTLFVLEFKVGSCHFHRGDAEQVWDYALDLKNFHNTSHHRQIVPVLIATEATASARQMAVEFDADGVCRPVFAGSAQLGSVIEAVLRARSDATLDYEEWARGRYLPTPTIIDAARALYGGHGVADLSRSDADAMNLTRTSEAINRIIEESRDANQKAICFVTGVPGAGKTLVGLNTATEHIDRASDLYSVFLSGNGPLVSILREALARDKVRREADLGNRFRIGKARSEVQAFVQNVHHFRDECLRDPSRPPPEHVALFDEAQRAWNLEKTADFMRRKKGRPGFEMSEPAFLISCMDRHLDWAVIVCLVGGGQEINTGEAGIAEWIRAVVAAFPHWNLYLSPKLQGSEFATGEVLQSLSTRLRVHECEELHLGVSMRSFRAERVSELVKYILDIDAARARDALDAVRERYPIKLCRSVSLAKSWLRQQARGSERFGLVVSSQAQRLKPHAIDVRTPLDPVHWFLDPREDVRSSFYLEDAATEFHVQGLELDWTAVVWDADLRVSPGGWGHWSFRGDRWQRINASDRQTYLKNAYRVLLTRARQGMVIVVPEGDRSDPTRSPQFYDPTFEYLRGLGLDVLAD